MERLNKELIIHNTKTDVTLFLNETATLIFDSICIKSATDISKELVSLYAKENKYIKALVLKTIDSFIDQDLIEEV